MSDNQSALSRSQPKQTNSQSLDLASLRKSNRPKKPSLLYADGFEDTQKVIGRKANTKGGRSSNKVNNDNLSTSEKELDNKMEEEITERGAGLDERLDDDEDEYLKFTVPEDFEDTFGDKHGYVTFKLQTMEESRSAQRSSASNEASNYQMRKTKKKPAYHEDYAYGIDTKKSKDKVKPASQLPQQPAKKGKATGKPANAAPATQDFLDIVLSAAIAAQANQATNDTTGPRSPRVNRSGASDTYPGAGKISAPKFSLNDEKPGSVSKKPKTSVKKAEPSKQQYYPQNDEFYQRTLEYKDHYIKEAIVDGNTVTLKHTKNQPISMPYKKQKFDFRQKELLDSKIFNGIGDNKELKTEAGIEEEEPQQENNAQAGNLDSKEYTEWRKELKEKEQALALRFKEVLKGYKPSILV